MPPLAVIRTPDQKVRVFVSSTLEELAPERAVVRAAVERLRMAPVMFELGARPHPPRALYRAYLEQSHIFVAIYWQSYGWVAPDMGISGIEDEYELSAGKPCLVYIKEPAPDRQPALDEFFERVMAEDRVSFKRFETAEQLAELVSGDLALLLTEQFEAGTDVAEAASAVRPRPLPVPPTGLVGRERDLEQVCALIEQEDARLLTLSGVGGIGKTRLALAAAGAIGDRFADGVGFADLSSVTDPALVPLAVAVAMGIPREGKRPLGELLVERLTDVEALLVLDNFEQVIEAAPFVSELLASCPALKVIVTSRTLLRLRGEHEFHVMPLETPPVGEPVAAGAVAGTAAVRLFVERARETEPDFEVDEANAEAVTRLCGRLEGIPLAIELAAARVRVLPPDALLDRISDRLALPSGPADLPERQRTLTATIDWSYDLLDQQEREVFAALSVFVGGFTLTSAEEICQSGPGADVLELASSLVDKSLVMPHEAAAEPRFRMMEAVREYAQERLEESGNGDETRRRMAQYFARFGEQAAAGLITADHQAWLSRIDPEVDNIRAALSWAIEAGELDLAEVIMVGPWIYWWARGYVPELRPLAERIFEMNPHLEPETRSLMLQSVASSRSLTGDSEAAIPVLQELLDLVRDLGDERGVAMVQAEIAANIPLESPAEARALLTAAADTLRRLGDHWGAAYAVGILGQVVLQEGDAEEAGRLQEEALQHARTVESDHLVGLALNQRGFAALARGDLELARSRFAESAELHRRVRSREGLAYCLEGLARVALAEDRPELAAKAIGAADAIRDTIGAGVWPIMRWLRTPLVADVEAALDPATFESVRSAGAETDPYEVVDELLG